jgi:hypothetical protein
MRKLISDFSDNLQVDIFFVGRKIKGVGDVGFRGHATDWAVTFKKPCAHP